MLPMCLLSLLLALPPHPNSLSTSRVVVTGAAARLELRCQAQSLLEVFGTDADADGDGWLNDTELQALRDPLLAYVNERFVLRAGSGGDGRAGTVLVGTLAALSATPPDTEAAWPTQWVDLTLDYRAAELIPDLMLEVMLFRESAPDHSDLCQLVWNGGEPLETQFWMGQFRRYFAPESPPEARSMLGWVELGIRHILSGWDHIAFVAALILAAGTLRSLLGVITAFTLAHSVTLALAATGVVHVSSRPVEVVIALSIAWVGLATLFAKQPRARWREAFVFGLVHGLGFAGFLGEALYGEPQPLRALIGFNLGVEAGQLIVVAAVLAVLAAMALPATLARRRAMLSRSSTSAPDTARDAARDAAPDTARDAAPDTARDAAPDTARDAAPDTAREAVRDAVRDGQSRWLAPRAVRLPACATAVLLSTYWIVQRVGGL